ncbi:MAG TPA: VanZ family protein [Candidatus Blautia intestinipullorum]|nr:VanZ family protein [Candidatus Blautia intestinipullorum]
MEYIIQIIGNVLAALYQAGGASLVIAVLFMSAYMRARKTGVGPVVQGWIQEFRTNTLFRRQFFLVFYICMMLFRTLFCRSIWGNPLDNVLGVWGFHKEDGSIYTENIENLILFLPMIPLLFWMLEEKEHNKKRPLQTVLARSVYVSFGFSLLIELCQLFLKIGTFQLTDLFFNTLGGALGGLLYWGFDRSRKRAAAYIRKLGGWDTEEWNPPAEDSSRLPIIKAETADTEKEKTFVPVQEKTEGQQDHSTETDASGIPLTPEQEEEICTLIREAGQKMLHAKLSDDAVHEKDGPANFCTDFDMEIQKFLIQGLGRILPGAEFFGEEETEGNAGSKASGEYTFYIDPIDGTTNFMFRYNHSCVSVGLAYQGKIAAGFVYNPYVDEMYSAVRGKGSFLNGKRLKIQDKSIDEGIAAFGCARYNDENVEVLFDTVKELFRRSLSIRSGGSAALDLCRIASGSNVIYLEMKLQPYDYAAASVIVEEAGGVIAQIDASPITLHKPCSILAGTRRGCDETRKLISFIER